MSTRYLFDPGYSHRRVSMDSDKVVLVMVGLPARGKSYISKKTGIYLSWMGLRAKTFNVGNHRRNVVTNVPQTSNFFDADNSSARDMREQLAITVLGELLTWLSNEGDVAIFDATNTTRDRRDNVLLHIRAFSPRINVLFIESICDDPDVLESNFMQKIANSPDYRKMPVEEAIADLRLRIVNYEKVYQPIEDDTKSYIKLINLQSKVVCNRVFGRIGHQIASFLMCLNIVKRKIFLTRCGHSEGVDDYNEFILSRQLKRTYSGRLTLKATDEDEEQEGASESAPPPDPETAAVTPLSSDGRAFALRLAALMNKQVKDPKNTLATYSSTSNRAIETVAEVESISKTEWPALNMLDTGLLAGKSVYQICNSNTEIFNSFIKDPFGYRVPGGESFEDVVQRLENVVREIERLTSSVLVVSHLTTLQALYGYFLGLPGDRFCTISIPQHIVIQLEPTQYGWEETRYDLSKVTFEDD